jgi:hypothetical protein
MSKQAVVKPEYRAEDPQAAWGRLQDLMKKALNTPKPVADKAAGRESGKIPTQEDTSHGDRS